MAAMNVGKLQGSIGYFSSLSPSKLSPVLCGHKILCQKQQWAAGLSIPITISSNKISSNMKMRMKGVVVRCKAGTVGESDFQEKVLNSDLPVLLDFVAPWCGPCKLIAPIIDWAAQEYEGKLRVFKIDHDSNPQLVANYKVYGLPALILFKDGKEVPGSRREGAITKAKLKEYLDQLLESVAMI